MRKALTVVILCGALLAPLIAAAQSTAPAQSPALPENAEERMLQLAQILGSLHYVRKLCEPADGDFWRDRMMEMIRLEKPSVAERDQLTQQFNQGFNDATTRFPTCTQDAKEFAAATARQGEALAQALSDSINMSPGPG